VAEQRRGELWASQSEASKPKFRLNWYKRYFLHCTTERVVGEICAAYFENRQSRLFGPTFLTNLKV
jgi:hypothetical protein